MCSSASAPAQSRTHVTDLLASQDSNHATHQGAYDRIVGHRGIGPAVRRAWRWLCWSLLRLVPARPHAVVHGWPDDEGNAVEILRALGRRYGGKVYWLLSDLGYTGPVHVAAELADGRIIRVRKNSLHSLGVALTAETTFFTHGLFTAVAPPHNRLVVNMWHGDGPKVVPGIRQIRSTVAVAGTALWGGSKAQELELPPEAVAIVGYPRVDQFNSIPRTEVLARLGLDQCRPTILWLPTYRMARGPHNRRWCDAADLSSSAAVRQFVGAISAAGEDLRLQVVVKPHPLDDDNYEFTGIPVLKQPQLDELGVTFYQLLGAADGIISDVSSVWTDFLRLNRPIGFFIPDLEDLKSGRGLNVDDLADLLPGPRLVSSADVRCFLETVAQNPDELRPSQYPAWTRIGVMQGEHVADRLLDWLDDFQRARGRRALFAQQDERRAVVTEGP
jgi:CDP-glycerol glycerophosphotransferase